MQKPINLYFLMYCFALLIFQSCASHFLISEKKITNSLSKCNEIRKNLKAERYFIIRKGNNAYSFKDIIIEQDNNNISGYASFIPKNHRVFENYGDALNIHDYNKYDRSIYGNEFDTLNGRYTKIHETHIYLKKLPIIQKDAVTKIEFNMDEIERIVHYDTGNGKNADSSLGVASNVLGVGIAVGLITGVVVLIHEILTVSFTFK